MQIHRDPYDINWAQKPEPDRKPEPADWFRSEYNERWRGRGYSAAPRELVHYRPCIYVDGRHKVAGQDCPHGPRS